MTQQLIDAIKKYSSANPGRPIKPGNPNSLSGWMQLYFLLDVKNQSTETRKAKRNDLNKFLTFYRVFTRSDHLSRWISPITSAFREELLSQVSPQTGQPYKPATLNRIIKTVKHFASWLAIKYPFADGDPTLRTKFIVEEESQCLWLMPNEIDAIEAVLKKQLSAHKKKKSIFLMPALFYCLLHTGLRESELINLNVDQYADGGFWRVVRKNNQITSFIAISALAQDYLDAYLLKRALSPHDPLFVSASGQRFSGREVRRVCERLAKQAREELNNPLFHFSPHQLRHTFLKRIADEHGLPIAHQMSGNLSIKEIARYVESNQQEINESAENLLL